MLRLGETPVPRRSSGTYAMPAAIAVARVAGAQRLPADSNRPRRWRPHAGDRLGELALAVAGHARDGDDLAGTHDERGAFHGRLAAVALRPDALELEHRVTSGPRARLSGVVELPPHHQRGERAWRRLRGLHRPERVAAAEHRHPVGDRLHLVQLVRDEDHRPSLRRHLAHRLEQHVRLLRRQHRGRLVEDEDARFAVERLQDLDALLLAERELPDPGARVDVQPVALRELGDALLDRARPQAERPALAAVVAEDDVLRHREGLDEPEMLVHHRDPGLERVARRVEVHPAAVDEDLAVVRPVEAREDVRERALARAVLAEQRVHLAGGGLEVDALVRDDAREALRDPAHRDGGRGRGAAGAPPFCRGCGH